MNRRLIAEIHFASGREQRRFDEEIAAIIGSEPLPEADWEDVFARWKYQVDVRWPAFYREFGKRKGFPLDHARRRTVEQSKRQANRLYLESQTKALLNHPVRLVSATAIVNVGNFSLETPRRLNSDTNRPTHNQSQINRSGTRVQFEGPVLLDRVEFLLPEGLADSADAATHLLVHIGLEDLGVLVRGRQVTARPSRALDDAVHLDWIEIGWRQREEMVPVSNIAVYGRSVDRFPFDLRPSVRSAAETVEEAALWITGNYAARLKNRAARHLVTHGVLKIGMEMRQVTALLGLPARVSPAQFAYERPRRPDCGETEDFRLAFTVGPDGTVVEIHLTQ